jgi:hypothetical protein
VTSWVRVELIDGRAVIVPADTFAAAARQVVCGKGEIRRFDFWSPLVDPDLKVSP